MISFISVPPTAIKTALPNSVSGTYQANSITISWTGNSSSTKFTMTSSNVIKGNYISFAFSTDDQMVSNIIEIDIRKF